MLLQLSVLRCGLSNARPVKANRRGRLTLLGALGSVNAQRAEAAVLAQSARIARVAAVQRQSAIVRWALTVEIVRNAVVGGSYPLDSLPDRNSIASCTNGFSSGTNWTSCRAIRVKPPPELRGELLGPDPIRDRGNVGVFPDIDSKTSWRRRRS